MWPINPCSVQQRFQQSRAHSPASDPHKRKRPSPHTAFNDALNAVYRLSHTQIAWKQEKEVRTVIQMQSRVCPQKEAAVVPKALAQSLIVVGVD